MLNIYNWQIQIRKGLLEIVLLNLLSDGPRHGYEMVQLLKQMKGLTIREGNTYPILARLQIEGLVTTHTEASSEGPKRKYFKLTKYGKKTLEKMNVRMEQIIESFQNIQKRV